MKCWGRGSSIGGFLALLILIGRGACADSIPPASGYLRTNFTDQDGLSANIIDAIVQTKNGTLWIGTPVGLDRFDGHSFSRASTKPVATLGIGPDGDLWAATDQGVNRFRADQLERWELLSPITYHLGQKTDDVVNCMLVGGDGTVWASNDKGLYQLISGAFKLVASARSLSRIEEAHDGHLLIVRRGWISGMGRPSACPSSRIDSFVRR